jgi:hypothetical protein
LEFVDAYGRSLDTYAISLGEEKMVQVPKGDGDVSLQKDGERLLLKNGSTTVEIDAKTGLCMRKMSAGKWTTFQGPYFHNFQVQRYLAEEPNGKRGVMTTYYEAPEVSQWKMSSLKVDERKGEVVIHVKGTMAEVETSLSYRFLGNGLMEVDYDFKSISGLDTPGLVFSHYGPLLLESGIRFFVDDSYEKVSWNRNAYWTHYPEGHLGAAKGSVPLFSMDKPTWGVAPTTRWEKDVHDWFFQGLEVPEGKLLTNEGRSAKGSMLHYTLSSDKSRLTVYGDGKSKAARYGKLRDGRYHLDLLDTLTYHYLFGGGFGLVRPQEENANSFTLKFQ